MSGEWIDEGASERSAARIEPVRHLLVDNGGEWLMWCSAGKGSRQTAVSTNKRFCRECLALANEAIEDDTLSPADVSGWPAKERSTR